METIIDMNEVDAAFYINYGRAMAAWGDLENSLANLMLALSKVKPEFGFAMFYSAKSFAGRLEMVRACVPVVRTTPQGRHYLKEALNKASGYATVRNRLAHDPHRLDLPAAVARTAGARYIVSLRGEPPLRSDETENFRLNVALLSSAILFNLDGRKLLKEPELGLALLALMPADPAASQTDLKAANALLGELVRL